MTDTARLFAVREGDRADPAMVVTFLAGIVLGVVHPAGFVVGGALVGLVASTPARAVVLGVYFGGVTLVLAGLVEAFVGQLWPTLPVVATVPVVVAAALAVPTLVAGAVRAAT